ncbi:MAG TPA: hypothetical protein VMZ53_30095 [Kofleriaceae bacterium]|nr:hypothetical protein [Kofleriaceae bacterium]
MGRFHYVVVLAALAVPATASAEVFKLYGEAQGGGLFGKGIAGDHKEESAFQGGRGAYGVAAGAQFLIFDVNIRHNQFINGDGLTTWTQFTGGFNFGFDTGTEQEKKENKGGYVGFGVGLAFGVGTGAQVDPPLDNSQVTDKGFLLEGKLNFGKHLNKVFDIGLQVPVSYGYLFKSGNGATANNTETQYQSVQIEALLVLRANIRFI